MISPERVYWNWLPDPDLIQHISFPFLVLGLLLALLEIRYHHVVVRAEQWVRTSGPRLRSSAGYENLSSFWHGQWSKEARNGALFLIIVTGILQALYFIIMIKGVPAFLGTWIALTLIGMLGMRFSESSDELVRLACLIAVMATCIQIGIAHVIALVASRTAERALAYFDRTGGKAIGRMGLTLATFGLLCEAYQLMRLSRVEYWSVLALTPLVLWAAAFFFVRMLRRGEVKSVTLRVDDGQDALEP